MSAHDFEKQVQSTMEQLKLRPSEAVWTKVDKRIRMERRRRRILLWLPAMVLMLGAGGYFFYTHQTSEKQITASDNNSTLQQSVSPNEGNTAAYPATPVQPSNTTEKNSGDNSAAPAVANTDASPSTLHAADQPGSTPPAAPAVSSEQPAIVSPKDAAQQPADPGIAKKESNTPDASVTTVNKNLPAGISAENKIVTGKTEKNSNKNSGTRQQDVIAKAPTVSPAYDGNNQPFSLKAGKTSSKDRPTLNKASLVQLERSSAKPTANDKNIAPAGNTTTVYNSGQQQVSTEADQREHDLAYSTPGYHRLTSLNNELPGTLNPVFDKRLFKSIPRHQRLAMLNNLEEEKLKKTSKWSYGVVASGGGSHISKGDPFDIFNKKNKEPENLAQNSPTTGVSGAVGFNNGAATYNKPSEISMGFSYTVGGFVQRKVSERISFSAGLEYGYYSTKMEVGTLVNSPANVRSADQQDKHVNQYYQGRNNFMANSFVPMYGIPPPTETKKYTNKYHFLELPVKMHWRVNDGEILPILVDAGFTVSQLLSTNALHYDGTNDFYYEDKSYFNKTQFGMNVGVSFALFNNSKHPLWIGPTAKYQLTNLLSTKVSNGQHIWSFGLSAKMFLKK
ncbi:outer membrane beta-barrel protein [Pseudoflavitalea sp. G-6-1-2]|uniref:outer membrane beta-barrel protein n=1 Tax=Pseudoflavitalea sp. G-6-1-2 TaxID=2728841 RepID=UPI00146C0505|nr:outer membrane beta-barrel protein [Pseudoflavitalea sp. G-6-1-2]NML21074.1 outer membrane beta-barrel protein [Pseudoflavitalea sp. G-6-1-2]